MSESVAIYIVDERESLQEMLRDFATQVPKEVMVHSVADFGDVPATREPMLVCIPGDSIGSIPDRLPEYSVAVLSPEVDGQLVGRSRMMPQVAAVVGVEEGRGPRTWELMMLLEWQLSRNFARSLGHWCFAPEGTTHLEWQVYSTGDLRDLVEHLESMARDMRLPRQTVGRLTGAAHEMLMNALYDAPVDAEGRPLYAFERAKKIRVEDRDAPRVHCSFDAKCLLLSVSDRFGGLRREHVYASMHRGFVGARAGSHAEDVIDTSHGGAGIGMHRIWSAANASVFEVEPGRMTRQMVFLDLKLDNRSQRKAQRSLHFAMRGGSS